MRESRDAAVVSAFAVKPISFRTHVMVENWFLRHVKYADQEEFRSTGVGIISTSKNRIWSTKPMFT